LFDERACHDPSMILGQECRGSLYCAAVEWHRQPVTTLRSLRLELGLTQAEHAALLGVPINSFRMWDSGIRVTPLDIITRSRSEIARRARENEPVGLKVLAGEFGVNIHTLRAAVRSGRLEAVFSTRSIFGLPRRSATRAAVARFLTLYYRRPLRSSRPSRPHFQSCRMISTR
jgi:transcriptional regulator with XRE-family HTH domain